jgi:multidrug efflux pump subunit AcrA (membrane-fusion protein)
MHCPLGRPHPKPQFLGASLAALLTSCLGCGKDVLPTIGQPVPRVTVAEVINQEVIDSDDYTGRSEASAIVEVRSRVFGFLKSIEFKDGDYAKE